MDAAPWEFAPGSPLPPPPFLGGELAGAPELRSAMPMILPVEAPFAFQAGLAHEATGEPDLYHDPWRILATATPGLEEEWAPPDTILSEPAAAREAGPVGEAMLLPDLDNIYVGGDLGPEDHFDLYRLPISRNLRDLRMRIHHQLPEGAAGPAPDIAVWLYDAFGRAMGRWRVKAGKVLDLDLLSVRAPRSSELILAIEQLHPTSSAGGSSGASSAYGMDISRSYRDQAVPGSTESGPDEPTIGVDDPDPGDTGPVRFQAGPGWGAGGTALPPLNVAAGGGESAPPLAVAAATEWGSGRPAGKSSAAQAAPPATGLLGPDEPVDAAGGEEDGPDPESEPLPERLVRLSRSANRKAEAGDLGPSVAALDAHDPAAGPSGAGESVDRVLESWEGPTLAASLLIDPAPGLPPSPSDRRSEAARMIASATPPPPALPAPRIAAGAGIDRSAEEDVPEAAPRPTFKTALVTTAALVVGLWLPDLGSPRRLPGTRRGVAALLRRMKRARGG